jgi:predicted dithiol-disulfide oxidoreductase (DUF899 family)
MKHRVVSHDEWIKARKQFLAEEKEFTRIRDSLSQKRRELPWERVEKDYVFDGQGGKETLAQLFAGRSQLIVYHFMFDPEWDAGCPSCSFWADNFNGIDVHLAHRDVTFLAISRAPLAKLQAYRKRMGWSFKWLSSFGSDFNHDYYVTFTPEEMATGTGFHNYTRTTPPISEMVGVSVFYEDEKGGVFAIGKLTYVR